MSNVNSGGSSNNTARRNRFSFLPPSQFFGLCCAPEPKEEERFEVRFESKLDFKTKPKVKLLSQLGFVFVSNLNRNGGTKT